MSKAFCYTSKYTTYDTFYGLGKLHLKTVCYCKHMLLSQCYRLDCPAYLLDSSATSLTEGQEIFLELKVFF